MVRKKPRSTYYTQSVSCVSRSVASNQDSQVLLLLLLFSNIHEHFRLNLRGNLVKKQSENRNKPCQKEEN